MTSTSWAPRRPLARAVFAEADLFDEGQTGLNAAGVELIRQLGSPLGTDAIGLIAVSAGHGDTSNETCHLWLVRAAALRSQIRELGPREISIAADTQALRLVALFVNTLPAGGVRSLHVTVTSWHIPGASTRATDEMPTGS